MRSNLSRIPSIWKTLLAILVAMAVNGCAGFQVENDMNLHEQLFKCPDRPNCVSSDAKDSRHAIDPMVLIGDAATGWAAVQALVSRLSRSTVVKATDRYLHVTFKSRLFRFIDDLELKLDLQSGTISIRSASRAGYFDLGVNRRRVESLRKQMTADGLIR